MLIKIPYDGAEVEVRCPDGASLLEAPKPSILGDDILREKIVSGIAKYIGLSSPRKIGIVINDATRRLPTPKILKIISEVIPTSESTILIATGTHRAPSDEEFDIMMGEMRDSYDNRIVVHDCRDRDALVKLGVTSRGTPVEINRALMKCDRIITINSIEPHFFAGFTGGRKSIIPGLASLETTVANHSHAKDENACSLSLRKNPVHLDLEEAVNLFDKNVIFSIQLITSRDGEAAAVFCGDLDSSFSDACRKAGELFSVGIENKYNIVLAIGEPPLDINLYQLQKGQEHGAEAVADGGILIVVGACNEGTGSEYFMKLADEYPTPDSVLSSKAMNDNRFGMHKLVKTARRLRAIKIWYVTKLDDKSVRKVYFEPQSSVQAALDEAIKILGPNASVAILRDACFVVPTIYAYEGGS